MAGAPADSEVTISATDEEIQLMLYPRRGNPRDASDLFEHVQCEFGHDKAFQYIFVVADRSMSLQKPSASRGIWKKEHRDDDGD
eukprot:3636433-Pyramimonas_sp.AAC.1